MTHKLSTRWTTLLILTLLLAACISSPPGATPNAQTLFQMMTGTQPSNRPTISAVSLFQGADFLRGMNVMDQLGQLFDRGRQAGGLATERLRTTSLTSMTKRPQVSRPLVGQHYR